jgi:2-keto-3-deoxy-L-rhamnonate aldolase RhmA
MSACDRIKEVAHRHGKKVCMHCASAEFAAAAVKRGFDMVMITSDLNSMIAGVKRQITTFNEALKGH